MSTSLEMHTVGVNMKLLHIIFLGCYHASNFNISDMMFIIEKQHTYVIAHFVDWIHTPFFNIEAQNTSAFCCCRC